MRAPISVESFDRYARIIRALIPNVDGVSVCNADGVAIQSLDFAGDTELLPAIERLTARRPDWASKPQFQLQASPGEADGNHGVGHLANDHRRWRITGVGRKHPGFETGQGDGR